MQELQKRNEYAVVNIARIAGACVILAKHCFLSDAYGMYWLNGFAKAVVQMYFVFSGYFFIKSGAADSPARQKHWMKHLLCLTLLWSAVFFVTDIPYVDRSAPHWFLDYIISETRDLCGLAFGDLWYVQNLIVVVALLVMLHKFEFSGKELLLYLTLTVFTEGKLLRALVAAAFGMYLASEKPGEKKAEHGKLCAAGFGAFVFLIVLYEMLEGGFDAVWVRYAANFAWNTTGLWLALVALCLDQRRCETGQQTGRTYYLRKLSTVIYFVHLVFVPLSYGFVARYLPSIAAYGGRSIVWSGTVAGLTLAASLVFGAAVLFLAKRKGFRWLKYLY